MRDFVCQRKMEYNSCRGMHNRLLIVNTANLSVYSQISIYLFTSSPFVSLTHTDTHTYIHTHPNIFLYQRLEPKEASSNMFQRLSALYIKRSVLIFEVQRSHVSESK